MSKLTEVLERIERRLKALNLSATAAATQAGLSADAIRNIRRAIKSPAKKDSPARVGVSTRTLDRLAPVLRTSASWLANGDGPEDVLPTAVSARDGIEALVQVLVFSVLRHRAKDTPAIDPARDTPELARVLLEALEQPPDPPTHGVTPEQALRARLAQAIERYGHPMH